MSGIEIDEPLIQEGRINVLMGQGQTAQVLRNLCYKVLENENGQKDWNVIVARMEKLFSVKLGKPDLDKNRGTIELHYEQSDIDSKLDIALAGRGLQQMLLVLSYLYSHKGSILLIDEPDAHLEILRQKQVYAILKDIAQDNKCQVIIATHSEVILDDAVDTDLTLLISGEAVNLATQQDIKSALKTYGIEHYYKAKVMPRLLYVNGSTDIAMLMELAKRLGHPAYDVLSGKINYYYTKNDYPEDSLDNQLDRIGGAFKNHKNHFSTLSHYVQNLKGIAILDSDGKEIPDETQNNLTIVYWKNYELENYFITPEVILNYVDSLHEENDTLFKQQQHEVMEQVINQWLLAQRFEGDKGQLAEFLKASKKFQQTVLKNVKMSGFAEQVFETYAKGSQQPILLNKGEFYQLVQHVNKNDIPQEVTEKLDLIVKCLQITEQE
jgi:ABC-type multidrug transport system ATPase subunit